MKRDERQLQVSAHPSEDVTVDTRGLSRLTLSILFLHPQQLSIVLRNAGNRRRHWTVECTDAGHKHVPLPTSSRSFTISVCLSLSASACCFRNCLISVTLSWINLCKESTSFFTEKQQTLSSWTHAMYTYIHAYDRQIDMDRQTDRQTDRHVRAYTHGAHAAGLTYLVDG